MYTFSYTLDTSFCRVKSSLHTVKIGIAPGVFRKLCVRGGRRMRSLISPIGIQDGVLGGIDRAVLGIGPSKRPRYVAEPHCRRLTALRNATMVSWYN